MPADACDKDTPGNMSCVGQHKCTGSNPMTQRNYGCDGAIRLFFGNHTTVDLDATGELAFKGQTYQCQLVQAIVLKQIYEARRAQNAFGHLVWMLNEIWRVLTHTPTPLATTDFGFPRPQQLPEGVLRNRGSVAPSHAAMLTCLLASIHPNSAVDRRAS